MIGQWGPRERWFCSIALSKGLLGIWRLTPKGLVGSWSFLRLSSGCLGDKVSDFALAHTLAMMNFLTTGLKQWGLLGHGLELPKQ